MDASCPCCGGVLLPVEEVPDRIAAPRSGDRFCAHCSWLIAREALQAEGEWRPFTCPSHEPVHPSERVTESVHHHGIGPLPDEPDDDPSKYFDEGGPSRPYQLVAALVWKAQGEPEYADIPLEELLMPPIEQWDMQQLAEILEGHGISSRTRYPVPGWAELRLIDTGGEALVIQGPTVVRGYSAYVKFIEELNDWRVFRIGPQVNPETLPP